MDEIGEMAGAGRHLAVYEPASNKYTPIDTCYATHHLQFDAQDRLWTSGGGPVLGWFDMRIWDATHDAQKAQGWTALVVDTNGRIRYANQATESMFLYAPGALRLEVQVPQSDAEAIRAKPAATRRARRPARAVMVTTAWTTRAAPGW